MSNGLRVYIYWHLYNEWYKLLVDDGLETEACGECSFIYTREIRYFGQRCGRLVQGCKHREDNCVFAYEVPFQFISLVPYDNYSFQ